jgi:hypothetical protein
VNETQITDKIKAYLKTVNGIFFWKQFGGMYGQSGLPDIVCCYKGRFIAFEVKTDKGKVSVLQEVTLRKIRAAGGIADVVRSIEEVRAVIAGIQGNGET